MATLNPFDLLDDDAEDPSLLIAAAQLQQKLAPPPASLPKKGPTEQPKPAANLPTKPLPPSQAVREARNDGHRGGGRGGPRGEFRGRGRGGFNRDSANGENTFGSSNGFSGGYGGYGGYRASEDGESGKPTERRGGYGGPRGEFRGGRRGGFNNGDADGENPRRPFERRSGTGHGSEFKREGAGRGNWGTPTDEFSPENEEPVNEGEKVVDAEKQVGEADADSSKDPSAAEPQEKEPEQKEMTLEEYEKSMEEKRKALLALKPEERKVNLDKSFESMQLISNKKNNDDVFVKLGTEKDKRKEPVEKAKKTKSINEFLKPADGESYYRPGGRGRGGRGGRGRGGYGGSNSAEAAPFQYNKNSVEASIPIGDVGQFPSLGGK